MNAVWRAEAEVEKGSWACRSLTVAVQKKMSRWISTRHA